MSRTKRCINHIIYLVCACLLLSVAAPIPAFAASSSSSNKNPLTSSMSPSNLYGVFKNADIRDVLSCIAANLGYNIIYTGGTTKVSIELDSLPPAQALDFVLKQVGMTYLIEGSTIIVGTREALTANFARSLSLTEIPLSYITSEVLAAQIKVLNLPVTIISIEYREDSLWVQGFPVDVAKVRELANVLDIAANQEPEDGGSTSVNKDVKTLTSIRMSGKITPTQFNRFLKTMGINYGVSADDGSDRLWIFATPKERAEVMQIHSSLNVKNADEVLNSADGTHILSIGTMSKDDAVSAITAACPNLTVISTNNQSKTICVIGPADEVTTAQELISMMRGQGSSLKNSFFVHYFNNISIAEASRRLQLMQFGDSVSWYALNNNVNEFSNGLFIYCNSDYVSEIRELLVALDEADTGLKNMYPVFTATSETGLRAWEYMLRDVFGLDAGNFETIPLASNMFVLFVRNISAEQALSIDAMIARVMNAPSVTYQDLSWTAYLKWCDANNIPQSDRTRENYLKWVETQLYQPNNTFADAPAGYGAKTSAEMAKAALKSYFDVYTPWWTDTPEELLRLAEAYLIEQGYPVDTCELVDSDTSYTPSTENDRGYLSVTIRVTFSDGDTFTYRVSLSLPKKSSTSNSDSNSSSTDTGDTSVIDEIKQDLDRFFSGYRPVWSDDPQQILRQVSLQLAGKSYGVSTCELIADRTEFTAPSETETGKLSVQIKIEARDGFSLVYPVTLTLPKTPAAGGTGNDTSPGGSGDSALPGGQTNPSPDSGTAIINGVQRLLP